MFLNSITGLAFHRADDISVEAFKTATISGRPMHCMAENLHRMIISYRTSPPGE